jgi:acyl-CoA-dependent ceramide synthase
MGTWIYLRHYLNIIILISGFYEFKTIGPYMLDWENEQFKCTISQIITTILLAGLQALNIVWLGWVLRTAYRYAFLNIAEDDRSDNDENEYAAEVREDAEIAARERELLLLGEERERRLEGKASGGENKKGIGRNRKKASR